MESGNKEQRCHHAVGKTSFEVTGSDIAMKGILEQRSDRRREQSNGSPHDPANTANSEHSDEIIAEIGKRLRSTDLEGVWHLHVAEIPLKLWGRHIYTAPQVGRFAFGTEFGRDDCTN